MDTLEGRTPSSVITWLPSRSGRVVGEALDMLLEARLDEGPLGVEEAERRLRGWYEARQAADA